MTPDSLLLFFFFVLGAVIGSFLNVVILRLPSEEESIVFPASHCPNCDHELAWYENIPFFSYLVLRGRCRNCQKKISLQYPLVELSMALCSLGLYLRFGFTLPTAIYFIFCAALLVIIWIDIYHQIIPDVISLPGIVLGFLFSLINPVVSWQDSLIGILVGGGILYLIATIYFLWRKHDGMGGGDIKLLAMIGAFLGWKSLPFVIFASSVSGSLIGILAMLKQGKGGQTRIPFGPFLSVAALVYLFYAEEIMRIYQLYLSGSYY
ncbi:MAG: A24 family peptidase [Thermodesulfobacteriota bacterium]